VLKDVPCWGDMHTKSQKFTTPPIKYKCFIMFDANIKFDESKIKIMDIEPFASRWSQNTKMVKNKFKM
jgi:hypothetical protein